MEPDWQEAYAHEANGEEPYVEVRAGLLGSAMELFKGCDELINHPDRRPAAGVRWLHEYLAATAIETQTVLDSKDIRRTWRWRRGRPWAWGVAAICG
jgi:hypothetical protein